MTVRTGTRIKLWLWVIVAVLGAVWLGPRIGDPWAGVVADEGRVLNVTVRWTPGVDVFIDRVIDEDHRIEHNLTSGTYRVRYTHWRGSAHIHAYGTVGQDSGLRCRLTEETARGGPQVLVDEHTPHSFEVRCDFGPWLLR